jgi:hypothetical protein
VLIPQRKYRRFWHRFLHDRTADAIAEALGSMTHVNVTIVPFLLGSEGRSSEVAEIAPAAAPPRRRAVKKAAQHTADIATVEGCIPIAEVQYRQPARVAGRVRSVRVQPLAGVASLEVTLVDASGSIIVVFVGRRRVPGIKPGARLVAESVVGQHGGRLALLNPIYELVAAPAHELPPTSH